MNVERVKAEARRLHKLIHEIETAHRNRPNSAGTKTFQAYFPDKNNLKRHRSTLEALLNLLHEEELAKIIAELKKENGK